MRRGKEAIVKGLILRSLLVLLVLVVLPAYAMPDIDPERDDPPGPIGGGGGCSYCSSGHCGCAAPPAGYYLVFSCTCSSVECTRSCDYYPL